MSTLTIPPARVDDIERAKDFLFAIYGEARWTEAAYLELSDRTNRKIELSEGRLIVPNTPTPEHQDIILNIAVILRAWALRYGGHAFVAALPVRLWSGKFREPDLLLFTAQHRDRVKKQHVEPPDLAVEVLSPATEKVDMQEKMREYAQAGIPEYWIVSTDAPELEQYVLERGQYRLQARLGAGETLRAATLPDLTVAMDEIYRTE